MMFLVLLDRIVAVFPRLIFQNMIMSCRTLEAEILALNAESFLSSGLFSSASPLSSLGYWRIGFSLYEGKFSRSACMQNQYEFRWLYGMVFMTILLSTISPL